MKLLRGSLPLRPLYLPEPGCHVVRPWQARPAAAAPDRDRLGTCLVAGLLTQSWWRRHCRRSARAQRRAAGAASGGPATLVAVGLEAERLRAEILRAAEAGGEREARIAKGLEILDAALRLLGPDGLVVAFNGGKDATVILHLARAAMAGLDPQDRRPVRSLYLPSEDEFPEVDDFVKSTGSSLDDVDFSVVFGGLGKGLDQVCAEAAATAAAQAAAAAGRRLSLGFVLGTKRGDPNAKGQGAFQPSSPRYPPFWRVNPILHWTYADVWHFLLRAGLPYCGMYDRGYTSIGQRANTEPNPVLRREDGSYGPAHELADDSLERAGRLRREASSLDEVTPDVPLPGGRCGLVVIGDEVLKGMVCDKNSAEATWRLRAAGVSLGRATVLPDDEEAIAEEVRRQSAAFDFVITSGGLGPTHDDVTMRGVARAFGMSLVFPKEERFRALLGKSHGTPGVPLTASQRRGAGVPSCYALRWLEGREWPVLQVRNVFVLPGVPEHFKSNVRAVLSSLVRCPGGKPPMRRLRLAAQEASIAELLRGFACSAPDVSIGSYPGEHGVTVKLEAPSEPAVALVARRLAGALPEGSVLSVDSEDAL